MCRDLLKAFFYVLFALAISLTANLFLLKQRAFKPELYKAYLAKNNIYTEISDETQHYFNTQSGNQNIPNNDPSILFSLTIFKEALSPKTTELLLNALIDGSFDYIKGNSKSFDTQKVIAKVLQKKSTDTNILDRIREQFKEYAQDFPICKTLDEQNCITEEEYEKLKDFKFKDLFSDLDEKTSTEDNDIEYNSTTGTLSVFREAYKSLDSVVIAGLIGTIITLFLILLTTPKKTHPLVKTLGISIVLSSISSAFLAGILLLTVWASTATLVLGSGAVSPNVITLIQKVIRGIAFEIQIPLYIICLIFLLTGIGIIYLSNFFKEPEEMTEIEKENMVEIHKVENAPQLSGVSRNSNL